MGNVQILLRQHVGAPCEAIVKVEIGRAHV